jgi:hypothetical protein
MYSRHVLKHVLKTYKLNHVLKHVLFITSFNEN